MDKIIEKFNKIHITVSGVFLSVFFVVVVFQVAVRIISPLLLKIPGSHPISIVWTEDIITYTFIWSVFLGASAMIYPERHFAFTSVSDGIKNPRAKTALHLAIMVLMLVFMVLMVYYGSIVTKKFWNYRGTSLPQLKRGWTWICLPVSGVCGSIYLIEKIVSDVKTLATGGRH